MARQFYAKWGLHPDGKIKGGASAKQLRLLLFYFFHEKT